jgi:hypothetical protein
MSTVSNIKILLYGRMLVLVLSLTDKLYNTITSYIQLLSFLLLLSLLLLSMISLVILLGTIVYYYFAFSFCSSVHVLSIFAAKNNWEGVGMKFRMNISYKFLITYITISMFRRLLSHHKIFMIFNVVCGLITVLCYILYMWNKITNIMEQRPS